jgi:hypothetical protein
MPLKKCFLPAVQRLKGEGLLSHKSDGCFSTTCQKGIFMVVLGAKVCYACLGKACAP